MLDLTPTQDLIMELLAARWRLGENIWTFDKRHKHAIEQLAEKGLANVIHGTVENTVRASLTLKGEEAYITKSYIPPVFADLFREGYMRRDPNNAPPLQEDNPYSKETW